MQVERMKPNNSKEELIYPLVKGARPLKIIPVWDKR